MSTSSQLLQDPVVHFNVSENKQWSLKICGDDNVHAYQNEACEESNDTAFVSLDEVPSESGESRRGSITTQDGIQLNNGQPTVPAKLSCAKVWASSQKYGMICILGVVILFIVLNVFLPANMKAPFFGFKEGEEDSEWIDLNDSATLSQISEEILHKHSIKIDSPMSLISKLPATTMKLHLAPQNQFQWSQWDISNFDVVESLVMEGPITESDIQFLIFAMPNLNSVSIYLGKEMCSLATTAEFNDSEYEIVKEHLNVRSLKISGMEVCSNLLGFLSRTYQFTKLESLALENVPIMSENVNSINTLLLSHRETLKSISFLNVVACNRCFLFDKMFFRWLDEGNLQFLQANSLSAKNALENFNLATPRVKRFESNVPCTKKERKSYIRNWISMDSHDEAKICV